MTVASAPDFLAPRALDEALSIKAERGEDATVVAGGTFVAALLNQGLLNPRCFLSLGSVSGLETVEVANGELRLGAMVRHRSVERSPDVATCWSALVQAFAEVASPRIRNQATVGGVLADADYASDPPAMLCALRARVVAASVRGEREIPVEELITGYYETSLQPDELIVEVRVPPAERAVYRKFRSRSHEDRPCVSVAAVRHGAELRVVVGAVASRLQLFPDLCAGSAFEIGSAYAHAIEPISDVRGSSSYRRRVIAVEVRRALEPLIAS
jgi:aerobic carbon-monoxide dehydrogenase medium subunit